MVEDKLEEALTVAEAGDMQEEASVVGDSREAFAEAEDKRVSWAVEEQVAEWERKQSVQPHEPSLRQQ